MNANTFCVLHKKITTRHYNITWMKMFIVMTKQQHKIAVVYIDGINCNLT